MGSQGSGVVSWLSPCWGYIWVTGGLTVGGCPGKPHISVLSEHLSDFYVVTHPFFFLHMNFRLGKIL